MKTTNEIRARHALEADSGDVDFENFKPKSRRTAGTVPSAYDDVNRSDTADRSWKRHRRTKYRA